MQSYENRIIPIIHFSLEFGDSKIGKEPSSTNVKGRIKSMVHLEF
jgi:hypothetical protein